MVDHCAKSELQLSCFCLLVGKKKHFLDGSYFFYCILQLPAISCWTTSSWTTELKTSAFLTGTTPCLDNVVTPPPK